MNALRALSGRWRNAKYGHPSGCDCGTCWAERECADELDNLAAVVEPMAEALRSALRAFEITVEELESESQQRMAGCRSIIDRGNAVLAAFEQESADAQK